MKVYHLALFALILFTSACVPQESITQTAIAQTQSYKSTAVAQTQSYENDMATGLAGTLTAVAPTSTQTLPPPTSTITPMPSPTPSGEFEFFDVSVEQISPDQVAVSFGYQIKKGIKIEKTVLGAWPVGCGNLLYSMSFVPFNPNGFYSGYISKGEAILLSLNKPGTCEAKSIKLFLFNSDTGKEIYQKTFDASYTLKKDN